MIQSAKNDAASVESLVAQAADDFVEALARGERPIIEAFAAQYPEISDQLQRILPAIDAMQALDADECHWPASANVSTSTSPVAINLPTARHTSTLVTTTMIAALLAVVVTVAAYVTGTARAIDDSNVTNAASNPDGP